MKLKMITVAMLLALGMNLVARDLAQMKNYRELSNLVYANLPANEQEQLLRLAVSSSLPAQSSAARSAISKHFKVNWNQLVNIYNNQGFNGVKAHLGITAPASPTTPSKASVEPGTIPEAPPLPPKKPAAPQHLQSDEQRLKMQEVEQKIAELKAEMGKAWNNSESLEKILLQRDRLVAGIDGLGLGHMDLKQAKEELDLMTPVILRRRIELQNIQAADTAKGGFEQRFFNLNLTKGITTKTEMNLLEEDIQILEKIIADIQKSPVLNEQDRDDFVNKAIARKEQVQNVIKAKVAQGTDEKGKQAYWENVQQEMKGWEDTVAKQIRGNLSTEQLKASREKLRNWHQTRVLDANLSKHQKEKINPRVDDLIHKLGVNN